MTTYLMFLMLLCQQSSDFGFDVDNANDNGVEPAIVTVFSGQVVDEIGRGVADVEVVLVVAGDKYKATTDSIGDFSITVPGDHTGQHTLTVKKSGYGDQSRTVEVYEDDLEPFTDVVLQGSLILVGEVLEFLEHNPVVGAKVVMRTPYRTEDTLTDEAGRFKFEKLLPGDVTLHTTADGFGKATTYASVSADDELVTVILEPEKKLHLTIVDHHQRPIAGVSVETELGPSRDYRSFDTDEHGRVTIDKLPSEASLIEIRLTHRDFVSTGQYDHAIELPENIYEVSKTLSMSEAAVIRGVVVDANNARNLNGAKVEIGTQLSDGNHHAFSRTDGFPLRFAVCPQAAT